MSDRGGNRPRFLRPGQGDPPDEELARDFPDAYLINAYVSDRGVKLDSLELYEPVFSRYGYTAEDVRYTIGNFSRRKAPS